MLEKCDRYYTLKFYSEQEKELHIHKDQLFNRKYTKPIEENFKTFLKGTIAKDWKQAGSSNKRSVEETMVEPHSGVPYS